MTKTTAFKRAAASSKRREFLTAYSTKELKTFRIYLAQDRSAGYAIDPSGELVNLFNHGSKPGLGKRLVKAAIRAGATKLNCFDGFLTRYYHQLGFRETERIPFEDRYAPAAWDYSTYGRPDVVFMETR